MTEFKVTVYMELDFKNMPEDIAEQLEEMLMKLMTKKTGDKTNIDVEKIK